MDIHSIRKDTKGLSDKIFLNSAGSSLMPEVVLKTMIDYLQQEEMNGGYETANRNAELITGFYEETAKLINAKASNMAFTSSATDAYIKALSSISFTEGDCIITTNDDYVSNQIAFISLQKKYNIEIIRLKNLPDHELDLEDLENIIQKRNPKLVAVTHIPTNSGLIQNVEGVGKICRKYNVLYLVDACQSVGQRVVDVEKIGCDFLTATGRKFLRGPRGTGFLYVSDRAIAQNLAPIFLDMSGAVWTGFNEYELIKTAKRFELWENSYAALLGFTEAVKYANNIGLSAIEDYNQKLSRKLRNALQNKGFRVLDEGNNLSSIITFCAQDGSIESIQKILKEHNVYFSVSPKNGALIDFTHKKVDGVIRFSPHYFNTSDEIEAVLEILSK
jgi:cysteine desulfurase/selenocysteine lyase